MLILSSKSGLGSKHKNIPLIQCYLIIDDIQMIAVVAVTGFTGINQRNVMQNYHITKLVCNSMGEEHQLITEKCKDDCKTKPSFKRSVATNFQNYTDPTLVTFTC